VGFGAYQRQFGLFEEIGLRSATPKPQRQCGVKLLQRRQLKALAFFKRYMMSHWFDLNILILENNKIKIRCDLLSEAIDPIVDN
jgi:hypothetical protein